MTGIAVIIPTYNHGDYLQHCLESLQSQKLMPDVIVVVNDGSTDNTEWVLKNTEKKIEVVEIFQQHKGANVARNAGLSYIKTYRPEIKYVAFCDADAAYYDDYLDMLYLAMVKSNEIFSYSGYGIINTQVGGFRTVMPQVYDKESLRNEPYIPMPALIKIEYLDEFPEDIDALQHWELFLRLSELGDGVLVNEILFDHYDDRNSITNTTNHLLARLQIAKKFNINAEISPDEEYDGVAFFMQNISSYSGGRVHSWLQILALTELGIPVKVYTDQIPPFINDFLMYKQPEIEVCDLETINVRAKLYWSSPYLGHVVATKLSRAYDKWAVLPFFDPPDWQKQYHDGESYESAIINPRRYRDLYHREKHDKMLFMSLTENGIDSYVEWYGFPKEKMRLLPTAINTRSVDFFDRFNITRKNWIVGVSRNVPSKRWEEALGAFIPFMDRYQYHIITNSDKNLKERADKFGIPRDRLVFHTGGISDMEKWSIMLQSKAMLMASHFEGFGMWLAEAMETGLPLACYTLPSLEEIEKTFDPTIGKHVHFAEYGNVDDLSSKLLNALEDDNFYTGKHNYRFEAVLRKTEELVDELRSKGAQI